MKKIKKLPLILTILSLVSFITQVKADVKVVTSIKPLHSLASYLMDGIGKPGLIVDGYASPHSFSMKPSHAKMLQNADIVFWVGEGMENFLKKPLETIDAHICILNKILKNCTFDSLFDITHTSFVLENISSFFILCILFCFDI